ncbi:Peptidase_C39 like family protein [Micromonospora echinaurantiaca]|uniref:Peptidase_C39 like family protein n=1 Tax=Micromonospora echinaurantiaca TaxID=47857 RepID=A0A1C5IYK9_9ACTN|nr:C39 family peptidase [Micromonospora echinaurantiaca]SCG63422.1 Peptidase_C39 like family protein [Micromonospora echinaurantiaca]
MKHHLKRQLRRIATERPYQVAAASAAALVLASGAGALAAGTEEAPTSAPAQATVAELRDAPAAASRGEARLGTAPSGAAPSSAAPSAAASSAAPNPDLTRKAAPKPPSRKILNYDYQAQTTFYNCGPAAVRNALSAAGIDRTQDALGAQLGTTEMGTNSANDTTRVLNAMVKGDPYRTRMISGGAATPAQMDQLQADVVRAITDKRGVVVNVAGSATDTNGGWHSFPGGHYIAVVGYDDDGRLVKIADSANPATASYWMTTIDLANWAATRGYSA